MRAAIAAGTQLLRRQGRDGTRDIALTALGVALPVALIVVLAGVLTGLQARADRSAWREPVAAASRSATFLQQRSGDALDGEPIDRVDVSPLDRGTESPSSATDGSRTDAPSTEAATPAGAVLPAPPGLPAFPAPDEVWVSPALAAQIEARPESRLTDRWPGEVVGTIGDDGLARPDELVVLVGHRADAFETTDGWGDLDHRMAGPFTASDALAVDRFATSGSVAGIVQIIAALAVIGAVLLFVPALQLSAAAARFTTNRRAVRLAALRLAGATPGQILTMAAVETVAASAIGAAVGILVAALLMRPLALVPLAGGSWFAADLWPGFLAVAAISVAVVVVNTTSVLLTLRRSASAPLGVITGQRRRRPSVLRVLVAGAMWALFLGTAAMARDGSSVWFLALGTAAVISSIAVLGPWLTWLLGAVAGRAARRPPLLLAGRRLQADPVGAFRPVAGIVLVGFVAGVILTTLPLLDGRASLEHPERVQLTVLGSDPSDPFSPVAAEPGLPGQVIPPEVVEEAESRVGDLALGPATTDELSLVVEVAPDDVEAARTALAGLIPGHVALTAFDDSWTERTMVGDLARAAGVATLTMVLLAVAATALAAAADILEQRPTLRALHLAGTSAAVLQRARAWQAVLPLGGATTLSVASGSAAGLVLLLAFGSPGLPPVPVVALLGLIVAGPVAGLLAATATRPLLRSATAA